MRVIKNTFKDAAQKQKLKAMLSLYAETAATDLEAEAKLNAPWTDRTGLARSTIRGGSGWKRLHLFIALGGNTHYFDFLELGRQKKYAILVPTIEKNAQQLINGYRKLFK